MTNKTRAQPATGTILPLPTKAELPRLRATIKRMKPATIPAGAHWENTLVGSYSTTQSPDGVMIHWKAKDGSERSALIEALSLDPSCETMRLELGWMIANMLRLEAAHALLSIPGPKEAMAEANFYHREEARWRCWAVLGGNPPPKPRRRGTCSD